MNTEPPDVAILAARLQRAFPSLSAYSSASLAVELCRIERAQHRHAERCCSGSDGGYVQRAYRADASVSWIHDPAAEERAGKRIRTQCVRWENRVVAYHDNGPINTLTVDERAAIKIELHGDPRGAVLKVRLPGEAEPVGV